MGGNATKTETTSQQTNPWAPAIPMLQNLIGQYGNQSTSVTPGQTTALNNAATAAAGLPDYTGQAGNAVTNLFGSNFNPQIGMLGNAYSTLQNNLNPTASGANLNPYSTPGFGDAIQTAMNDATNQVKSVYAGSGRDPSGAGSFAQSLGRGIMQGVSPTIAAQANQNTQNMMNANNTLYQAGGATATGQSGLMQQMLQNGLLGMQGASGIPGLALGNSQAQMGVANQQYNQPYQNLGSALAPALQLGAMGQQSNGTTTATQSNSMLSNILGGLMGGAGILGQTGAFGSGGWLGSAGSGLMSGLGSLGSLFAFSDENVKDNVIEIGKTFDGQSLYSYTYKGDDKPQVGLLAQDVEKRDPGAVIEIGGVKAVNYPRALSRSAQIGGMLSDTFKKAA